MKIETLAGVQTASLEINEKDEVEKIEIEIGNIKYNPAEIPVLVEGENAFNKKFEIDGQEIIFSTVFLGVPHTVVFIEKEGQYDVNDIGSKMEVHPMFLKKTNVNFVLPVSDDEIKIFTWERGAGRALLAEQGQVRRLFYSHKLKGLKNKIKVITEGGELEVKILSDRVKLIGGAQITFEGTVNLEKY